MSGRYPVDDATMAHCAEWAQANARKGEDAFGLFSMLWDFVNEHYREDGMPVDKSWSAIRDLAERVL